MSAAAAAAGGTGGDLDVKMHGLHFVFSGTTGTPAAAGGRGGDLDVEAGRVVLLEVLRHLPRARACVCLCVCGCVCAAACSVTDGDPAARAARRRGATTPRASSAPAGRVIF